MNAKQYCRFESSGTIRWGVFDSESVQPIRSAPWDDATPEGEPVAAASVRLIAPATPSKIVGVGRNYADHAAELGNKVPEIPLIFLKPPSSVIGPEQAIIYPKISKRVDFEGELGLVIGKRCRHVQHGQDALDCIFGVTCVNDVTARDLQKSDAQFTRGKGFDTFCPIGPVIVTGLDTGLDLAALRVETFLNGERRQSAPVTDMIFPPDVIIEFVSAVMTLEPGDVIATGTPSGVGPMQPGDMVEISIGGIGRLRNEVVQY